MIPEEQRIGCGLEGSRKRGPGNERHVRRSAQGDDDVVVWDLVLTSRGRRSDDSMLHVHGVDGGLDKPRTIECRSDGLSAVAKLEHTGTRLEQQWAQLHEVVAADERDVDIVPVPKQLVELARCSQSTNAAAEDDDAR